MSKFHGKAHTLVDLCSFSLESVNFHGFLGSLPLAEENGHI